MSEVASLGIPRDVLLDALGVLRAFIGYHVPARMKALGMFVAEVMRQR